MLRLREIIRKTMPFLLILALPLIEIALFIVVGRAIGVFWTLALVVAAGLLGAFVLRAQGLAVLARLRDSYGRREVPGRDILNAMLIGLAGGLLILPGFFSDAVALLLLLPPVRGLIYGFLSSRIVVAGGPPAPDPQAGRRLTVDLEDDEYRPR